MFYGCTFGALLHTIHAFTAAFCHHFCFVRFNFGFDFVEYFDYFVFFFVCSAAVILAWLPMYSFFLWCVVSGTQAHKVVESIWISSGWFCKHNFRLWCCSSLKLGTFFLRSFFVCLFFSPCRFHARCHTTFADAFGTSTRKRMAGYFAASNILTGCW